MRLLSKLFASIGTIYTIAVILLFATVADQPLGRLGYLPINPTLCALSLLSPFALRSIARGLILRSPDLALAPLLKNGLPFAGFFLIAITSLAFSALPTAHWMEGGKWIFLISYGFCISTLAAFVPSGLHFQRLFVTAAIMTLGLLLWSMIYDINYPGAFAELDARAAGFPGNANFTALVAVMVCASALNYSHGKALARNIVLFVATGAIVVTSMSRSGALNFVFLIGVFSYVRLAANGWRPREVVNVFATGSVIVLSCFAIAMIASSTGAISKQSRLYRLMNRQQVDDGSAASRLFAVKESLRLIDESPVLGHGTGFSRTMAELPHNLYLQQWVNNGIFGLVSLGLFLLASLYTFTERRYPPGQALILVTILGGAFSHNILDQRPFLILFGILLELSRQTSPAMARYASVAL